MFDYVERKGPDKEGDKVPAAGKGSLSVDGQAGIMELEAAEASRSVYGKIALITDTLSVYVFDGTIENVSADRNEAILKSCRDGEVRKVRLPENLMMVEQRILAEGDEGDKNIWREIGFEDLLADEDPHLSFFIEKETDRVLVIRKIIPTYQ